MKAVTTHYETAISNESPLIKKGIKWSLICHFVLLLMVIVKSIVLPGKAVPYIPTLKVDLVGLPDVLKKDLNRVARSQFDQDISKVLKQAEQKAKRIAEQKVPPAIKDEMVIKPKVAPHPIAPSDQASSTGKKSLEMKNKRALQRLKALSKIQDTSEVEVVKGNKISPGSSLSGDAREAATESYYDAVKDRLQENWALPAWIARQNLAAQVQIMIDARGQIRELKFVKSSGNPRFDEEVKRTLQESSPFPSPPDEIANSLVTNGILIGFPL
jgi:colicin import membrane protein